MVTYIETKSDVFGNVPALELEPSDASEDEGEGEEAEQDGEPD